MNSGSKIGSNHLEADKLFRIVVHHVVSVW